MQATIKARRFDFGQFKKAAVALGIIGGLAIGATATIVTRDASQPDASQAVAPSISRSAQPETLSYQFMEQNLYLPVAGAAPSATSADDIRFMEQNLYLPGAVTNHAADWRTLEENSWGEDFVFAGWTLDSTGSYFPSADDVPQTRPGQLAY